MFLNEKNRKNKQRQELETNRLMAIFVFVILLLYGMSRLYRVMTYGTTILAGLRANLAVILVAAAAAAAFFLMGLLQKKKGTLKTDRVFHPAFVGALFGVTALSALVIRVDMLRGMDILYVALPVMAVLYLVNLVYERQFLTLCVVEAAAIVAAYCCYRGAWERVPVTVIALVLAAVPPILALAEGKALQPARQLIFGKKVDRRYTLISYGVILILLAAALLLGGRAALIVTIALGVYLLGAAVYFTVRAM